MTPIPQAIAIVLARERKKKEEVAASDTTPRLACSTFTAEVARLHAGLEDDPVYAQVGGNPEGSSWWSRWSTWPEAGDKWSWVSAAVEVGKQEVPHLIAGRWHGCQCWGGAKGHNFFVLVAADGSTLIFDSQLSVGYDMQAVTLAAFLERYRLLWGADVMERRLVVL